MSDSAYATLVASFTKLYRYQHLAAIAAWDQAAMMPEHGNEARGAALSQPSAGGATRTRQQQQVLQDHARLL